MGQYRSEERQADGCSVALIPSQSAVIERAERKRQASMEKSDGRSGGWTEVPRSAVSVIKFRCECELHFTLRFPVAI